MRAAVLERVGRPLRSVELPVPVPGPGQVLLRVRACGVCRTDLHIADGELAAPRLPLVLGHQIVAERTDTGERVGVPWLGWTDGTCAYCRSGRENLCDVARFTGLDIDGGFAEYAVADERFCLPLPASLPDAGTPPRCCARASSGYRTLRMAGDARRLGIYGFGAAAHLVCQVAVREGREVFAVHAGRRRRGAGLRAVAGRGVGGRAPTSAARGARRRADLRARGRARARRAARPCARAATVVCGGIHMSDIPSFPYELLWGERVLRSRGEPDAGRRHRVPRDRAAHPGADARNAYPLERAADALDDLRAGRLQGAAVVVPG